MNADIALAILCITLGLILVCCGIAYLILYYFSRTFWEVRAKRINLREGAWWRISQTDAYTLAENAHGEMVNVHYVYPPDLRAEEDDHRFDSVLDQDQCECDGEAFLGGRVSSLRKAVLHAEAMNHWKARYDLKCKYYDQRHRTTVSFKERLDRHE